MGFGIFTSIFAVILLFKPLVCQQPNTDESFVVEFLTKMGFDPQKLHGFSFCSWRGVSCDEKGQYVVKFVASGLGLSGGIPETTLGKLSYLQVLDLSNNSITALPTDFWSLGSLTNLNLSHNMIASGFSVNIGNFVRIQTMDLSYNKFSGKIPETITSLHSMVVLNLSHNKFNSAIPLGILQCTSLETIDLSKNHLGGSLPKGFGSAFPRLKFLNLAGNGITGRGSDLSRMKMIRYLNVSGNFFQGPVVAVFDGPLEVIDLSRNQFQGHIAHVSYMEDQMVSGPFSFQTDSTTWVADVKQATSVPVVIFEKPLLNFTFADLLAATSRFDRGTLLAEGRFGPVYGGLLPGGIHVAVKVLVHGSTLTDQEAAREFEQLGQIKHPNLVPLTGYCLAGEQRIAIYEYMENGSLQNLLYDLPLGYQSPEDWSGDVWDDDNNSIQNIGSVGSQTTWPFRHRIAVGAARALAFLHHGCSPPIIHRDIKASSVYLDSNLEPRLSDFGLAKIFGNDLDNEITRGSPGYIPPEFLQPESSYPKTATPKSDVYGFGIILLELVTGKKPIDDSYSGEKEGSLVSWVRGLVRRNQALQAIDPKIRGTGPDGQMVEALKVGYLCTAETPTKRPSMQQVVGLLKDLEQIAV